MWLNRWAPRERSSHPPRRQRGPQTLPPGVRQVQESGPLRGQHPLVWRRRVEVAEGNTQVHLHHARRVGAVHHQDHPRPGAAGRQVGHREGRPRRERDVGYAHHPGAGSDAGPDGLEEFPGRAGRHGQRHHPERGPPPRGDQPPGLEAADVLVVGGQNLVAGPQVQTVGHEVHGLRGVPWHHPSPRLSPEKARQRGLEVVPRDPGRKGGGHPAAVFLHRLDHHAGGRPEGAVVQVDPVLRNQEGRADVLPERPVLRPSAARPPAPETLQGPGPRQGGPAQEGQERAAVRHATV